MATRQCKAYLAARAVILHEASLQKAVSQSLHLRCCHRHCHKLVSGCHQLVNCCLKKHPSQHLRIKQALIFASGLNSREMLFLMHVSMLLQPSLRQLSEPVPVSFPQKQPRCPHCSGGLRGPCLQQFLPNLLASVFPAENHRLAQAPHLRRLLPVTHHRLH